MNHLMGFDNEKEGAKILIETHEGGAVIGITNVDDRHNEIHLSRSQVATIAIILDAWKQLSGETTSA